MPPTAPRPGPSWTWALCFGVIAFSAAHAIPLPAPAYLPESGAWTLRPPEGAIAMHYYGVLGWGLLGAGLGPVWARTRWGRDGAPHAWAVTALAVALVYFVGVELWKLL
jgi:hypothetical protein